MSSSVPRDVQKCASRKTEQPRAGSGSERIAPYRLDQSRVEAYTTGFSQTSFFIPTLQRPHERRPMASRREQVFALFFRSLNTTSSHRMFSMATEGPNPPKETLTFKKESFWQTTSGSLPAGLNALRHVDNTAKLSNTSQFPWKRSPWLLDRKLRS